MRAPAQFVCLCVITMIYLFQCSPDTSAAIALVLPVALLSQMVSSSVQMLATSEPMAECVCGLFELRPKVRNVDIIKGYNYSHSLASHLLLIGHFTSLLRSLESMQTNERQKASRADSRRRVALVSISRDKN